MSRMGAEERDKDCLWVTVGHREQGEDPRRSRFGRGQLVTVRRAKRGFASVRCDCCDSTLRVMVHGSRYDRSMGTARQDDDLLRVTTFAWLGFLAGIIPFAWGAGVLVSAVCAAVGVAIGLRWMPMDEAPKRYPIAYVIGGSKPLKHVVRGAYVATYEAAVT